MKRIAIIVWLSISLIGFFHAQYRMAETDRILATQAGHPVTVLDLRPLHTGEQAKELLEQIGPAGRAAYRKILARGEYGFPLWMASLLFLSAWRLTRRDPTLLGRILVVIVLGLLFDLAENWQTISMIDAFPQVFTRNTFTALKWIIGGGTILLLLLLGISQFFNWAIHRRRT